MAKRDEVVRPDLFDRGLGRPCTTSNREKIMVLTTTSAAVLTSTVAQSLVSGAGDGAGTMFTAGLAIVAVGVLFSALRKVAQVVAALAAAAAAVGSIFLLVVVFIGLFAAALILNVPI
jgi:hypothetical protein